MLVPVMGGLYIAAALLMIILHGNMIPGMFRKHFLKGAFDVQAIFGGFVGSVSDARHQKACSPIEAGVGASATAAGSAGVSHPVKQGLVRSVIRIYRYCCHLLCNRIFTALLRRCTECRHGWHGICAGSYE
ncbi:MAG: alanine:cation symporter family protein [Clostridium fessum]